MNRLFRPRLAAAACLMIGILIEWTGFAPIALASPAGGVFGSLGPAEGVTLPGPRDNPCPPAQLCLSFDGSSEGGWCWQYGGVAPPYYGAFAECCQMEGCVCGVRYYLTTNGTDPCIPLAAYLWEDAGGIPGNVLAVVAGLDPCPVATWPTISTHDFSIPETRVSGRFWVGFWADFSEQACGYFIAADLDGLNEGCPYTNVAPGIGYPTGWHHLDEVFGIGTHAVGIGAWVEPGDCGPTPVTETSWGRIRQTYR